MNDGEWALFSIFIIAEEDKGIKELYRHLAQDGYACSIASDEEEIISQITERAPDLVLLEINSHSRIKELCYKVKQEKNLPIVAVIDREMLSNPNSHLDLIDDFITKPYDLREVKTRIKRLLCKTNTADSNEIIRCGDLVIDIVKYEVTVGGRQVILTFKEYDLLKFLASNQGRVFTREALLNKIWGYEYYGGDRTIDVHITRLRNKLENSPHTFIETVRNIGYRLQVDI